MRPALVIVVASTVVAPVAVAALAAGPPTPPASAASPLALSEIPADLLPVYQGAATICPGLPWQVLAAIGWVESRHAQGRADPATGDVQPPIVGPPIDGRPGLARIPDVTQRDRWAHASGPMQFLPTTWARWATSSPDRPPTASPGIDNAWDAIYTAARMLCAGRPRIEDLPAAVRSYNRSDPYVAKVMAKAQEYGLGTPVTPPPPANGAGERAVAAAMTQLGVPYVWGGASPSTGFDCSGLIQWAYAQIGVHLPRTTSQQILVGVPITLTELRPGDLVFSRSVRDGQIVNLGHVAIYAGAGKVVVAPRTGDVVSMRPLDPPRVQAARRVLKTP